MAVFKGFKLAIAVNLCHAKECKILNRNSIISVHTRSYFALCPNMKRKQVDIYYYPGKTQALQMLCLVQPYV